MANSGEFIEVLSPSALKDLNQANSEIVKLIANIDKAGASMRVIQTPSGVDAGSKNLTKSYNEQSASIAKLEAALIKQSATAKKLEAQSLKQSQSYNAINKQREKEIALLERTENVYNKVQAKLNLLSNEYKNLATRQELGMQLTAKEAQRYTFLQGKIQTYDKTLKAVDATMGKHQRNVGNYQGGIFGLSNSINQLTREMPAFTYSVQTGFMALSNNIPIFTDAIGNAVKQNKELIAQGKPVTSVLSQVASALFSFQTLMGVGITLLTVYGKEIGEWVSNLWGANEALDTLNETQKKYAGLKTQSRKDAVAEQMELAKYVSVLKQSNLPLEQKNIALKALKAQYPFYFKNLTDEQILNGNIKKELDAINIALEKRKEIEGATETNVGLKQKLIDLSKEKDELKSRIPILEANFRAAEKMRGEQGTAGLYAAALSSLSDAKNRLRKVNEAYDQTQKESIKIDTDIIKLKAETIALEYQETETTKKKIKVKKEDVKDTKTQKEVYDSFLDTLKELQRVQDEINQAKSDKSQAYTDVDNQQMLAEFALIDKAIAKQAELKKATEDFVQSFGDEFVSNSGLSAVFDIVNGRLDTFGDNWQAKTELIMEAVQQMYNFINEASQKNFDAEYARLEQQKNIAIEFAGDSTSAKEKIEAEYEVKRKEIARREAKAKQKQAIFNIAIDTAQAVIATLAKTPPPAGLPLAALMAVIGAAQIAIVSSQKIPQYWKGTDNAIGGLAWTQERGQEIITDKKGKIKDLGDSKGARLTMLEKGDKVLNASKTKQMMFNNDLNNMLVGSGINVITPINNGMTASEMDNVLSKHFSNIKTQNLNIDKRGFNYYLSNNGNLTKRTENRANGQGYIF